MATNTDLGFERFGDFSFRGRDIELVRGADYTYQNVVDRLISNIGDYLLLPAVGANISSYTGQSTTESLAARIERAIMRSLTRDKFMRVGDISIVSLVENSKIYLKIEIGTGDFIRDKIVINSIFNTSSGLFYATT